MACFRNHAASFVRHADVRDGTRAKYRQVLGFACDRLGDAAPEEITPARLDTLSAEAREAGLAPATRRRLLSLVGAVLRRAGAPCDVPRVRVPASAQKNPLSAEEAARVEAALAGPLAEGLRVMLHTGLRIGELRGLRPADWDGEAATLRVACSHEAADPTKSGHHRIVDVPDAVAPILARRAQGGGRMFLVCERAMRRALRGACSAAGVEPRRLQDLRHTRTTQLLLRGAPVLWVSKQMGHATPAFTMKEYGHLVVAPPAARREWANL